VEEIIPEPPKIETPPPPVQESVEEIIPEPPKIETPPPPVQESVEEIIPEPLVEETPVIPVEETPKETEALAPPVTPVQPEISQTARELNPRQKELLEKLKTLQKITRKDYAVMFNISVPTAARDLKELVDKKLLLPKGPLGPGRWYELL
jgi:hypothetical protein